MKKCEIFGTPIIAHKNLVWPIIITDSYKCPNCGSEYIFKDNPLHNVLLIGLYFLVSFTLYYSLKYELVKQLAIVICGFSICFFAHLYFRTHMIFANVNFKSKDTKPEEKLIDQTRKLD